MFSRAQSPRRLRTKLATLAAAVATAVAGLAVPQVINPVEADAQTRCPAVTVVAARGSGQNTRIWPTNYSPQAAWNSNGWEGETIRAFLHHAESRYRATHRGNSLMKDVHVLGLRPEFYPAVFPAIEIPRVSVPQTLGDVIAIVGAYGRPMLALGVASGTQFLNSVKTGRGGVLGAIAAYERSSGCRPKYILVGFSQGGMILSEHERTLANRNQLAGVVYFGNPMTAPNDPSNVGSRSRWGGMLGLFPNNTVRAAATPNRVNYCLPLDGVCDISPINLQDASDQGGGTHGRYYLARSQWDNQVSDAFGRFVDRVRFR